MSKRPSLQREYPFDVCVSFAGEDRKYVTAVVRGLQSKGVKVFYDDTSKVDLWGKDLYAHLADVYENQARYCVMFVSRAYARKLWTSHERRNAQARALRENREYILPVRLDSTTIPGLPDTVGYVDGASLRAAEIAEMVHAKLRPTSRRFFVPPDIDNLHKLVGSETAAERERVESILHDFVGALSRMTATERRVVVTVFSHACPCGLPFEAHMSLDKLRRFSKLPESRISKLAGGLRSLGIMATLRQDDADEYLGRDAKIGFEFDTLDGEVDVYDPALHPTAVVATAVGSGRMVYDVDCAVRVIADGNFYHLSLPEIRTAEDESSRATRMRVAEGRVGFQEEGTPGFQNHGTLRCRPASDRA